MEWLHAAILAIVQGLTEFLPISSSAHLILVPVILGWEDQGLAFDVAVHVGTLAAVVTYMRRELATLTVDWVRSLTAGRAYGDSALAWAVIAATVPAGVAGLLLDEVVATTLRSPLVIAAATLGFGVLLWWADVRARQRRTEHQLRWTDVVLIGFAQALALIPGTSRSGITITAGLAVGLTRTAAARFSFLLSIPLIVAAGGLKTVQLVESATPVDWADLALGAGLSAASAYLCIHLFLRLIERVSLLPFILYRLVLGAVLLVIFV